VACMTIFAQPTAMATTQLARRICFQDSPAELIEQIVERPQLSMNWVVVTEENGKRQLRMRWTVGNNTGLSRVCEQPAPRFMNKLSTSEIRAAVNCS